MESFGSVGAVVVVGVMSPPPLTPNRHRSSVACATAEERRDMLVNFGFVPMLLLLLFVRSFPLLWRSSAAVLKESLLSGLLGLLVSMCS